MGTVKMLEHSAMQALQHFHERYLSNPRDHRDVGNPNSIGTER